MFRPTQPLMPSSTQAVVFPEKKPIAGASSQALPTTAAGLEVLIKAFQKFGPSEQVHEIEHLRGELGRQAPAQLDSAREQVLDRIDALESKGIKSREAKGEPGLVYGICMDLLHTINHVRDALLFMPYLPTDQVQAQLPATGSAQPHVELKED